MTAQHVEEPSDPRVPPIPRTIGAIRAALPDDERRRAFLTEVLAAPLGPDLDQVVRKGWLEAMLTAVPGSEQRRERALTASAHVPLPELLLVDGE